MNKDWWSEEYGFFGDFYMEGDDSKEGYRVAQKQTLYERTIAEVDGVLNVLDLSAGSKILDCPCGYGRHSLELSKRGFFVTGSDLNSQHLAVVQKELEKGSFPIQIVKENMLDLNYDSQFDAVINMFYSFGFFESDEDNFKVLQNFFTALKSNGKFLMHTDVNIPFIEAGKYKHDEVRTTSQGGALRIVDIYDPVTKRIKGAWILKNKDGGETRKDYSVRVYTKEEFVDLCKQAGFRSCEVYSDWDKKSYSPDSEDMIIVATK
jgi:cyclopropane fatty-acyl-phospholipid synthase-like methyltransferase